MYDDPCKVMDRLMRVPSTDIVFSRVYLVIPKVVHTKFEIFSEIKQMYMKKTL